MLNNPFFLKTCSLSIWKSQLSTHCFVVLHAFSFTWLEKKTIFLDVPQNTRLLAFLLKTDYRSINRLMTPNYYFYHSIIPFLSL